MLIEQLNDVLIPCSTTGIEIGQKSRYADAFPWHTGTPTEEGLYLTVIKIDDGDGRYCYAYEPVFFKDFWGFRHIERPIVAWQKITPFEAGKGNT